MKKQIIFRNIKLPFDVPVQEAFELVRSKAKKAGIEIDSDSIKVYKKSVDARRVRSNQPKPCFVYSILTECDTKPGKEKLERADATVLQISEEVPETAGEKLDGRPVIVGMGPCGMFAALVLAKYGYRPVVIERGADAESRRAAVDRFYKSRVLEESNIQFGAGGAGTFSDGKLVTRINDPKCSFVLKMLCELGAPDEILYSAKPHVGTDKLLQIVKNADTKIKELGGEIRYNTRLSDIKISDNRVEEIVLSDKDRYNCPVLVLAVGHSARDTYEMLYERGVTMAAKPFSVGVRVEHFQKDVDYSLYGDYAGDKRLPIGEYNLSYREGERAVYTFCMCPGGEVVAAASEEGGVVTNGMSRYARDGVNANAALAVSVIPEDWGGHVLGGIEYQRRLERAAFALGGGGYAAVCETVGDFLAGKTRGLSSPVTVMPTYMNGNVKIDSLEKILPKRVSEMLMRGLDVFGGRMNCFKDKSALLTGVETRTSAPLRILRGESYTAIGIDNLYPGGEGAGYAGGITSAAVDGINIAYAIMKRWAPCDKTGQIRGSIV